MAEDSEGTVQGGGEASSSEESTTDTVVPPIVVLLLSLFALSSGAILVRLSNEAPSIAAFYRVLFTTLPLFPVAIWKYRDDFARITGRDLAFATLAGVALAIHFASWFESLEWTSVAASTTLVQSQPIFVTAGAWLLLRERITSRMALGTVVAVAGMAAMSLADLLTGVLVGPAPLLGNALALLAAVMMAGYVLAGRSLRQRVALIPYVVIVYSICTATLLIFVVSQGHPLTGYPPREWLIFAGLALGPGLFGHTVVNWVLEHLESSVVSVTLLGEPIGATILALVVLGETPTRFTVLGGAVVLAGIYFTVSDRKTAEESSS